MRRPLVTALNCAVVLGATACASPSVGGATGTQIKPDSFNLPSSINGLVVKREALPASLKKVSHSYIDAASFWTMREDTHVQATLEIAHFSAAAPVASGAFRSTIENSVLTGGVPTSVLVDGITVGQTTGLKSVVSEWISGRKLYVLTTLQTYTEGRGLLEGVVQAVSV